jgi:hypothetical protein
MEYSCCFTRGQLHKEGTRVDVAYTYPCMCQRLCMFSGQRLAMASSLQWRQYCGLSCSGNLEGGSLSQPTGRTSSDRFVGHKLSIVVQNW